VLRADDITTFMCRLFSKLGASASWNPQGLSMPVIGLIIIIIIIIIIYLTANGLSPGGSGYNACT